MASQCDVLGDVDASSDAQCRPEDEFRRFLWTGSETSQVGRFKNFLQKITFVICYSYLSWQFLIP